MMRKTKISLALSLIFTLWALPVEVAAQVYRYVDKNGVVHFTDTPTDKKFAPLYGTETEGFQSIYYTKNIALQRAQNKLEYVVKGTVTIITKAGMGSGFLINPAGFAITNYHVVGNEDLLVVTSDGKQIVARTVRAVPEKDLALIKLSGEGYAYLPLATLDNIPLGKDVYAIGTPSPSLQGLVVPLSNSISKGIVSAIRKLGIVNLIQTDVPVNPGNSGGPLVIPEGLVIGVVTLKYSPYVGLGFAISSDDIISNLNLLPAEGENSTSETGSR